ncbi:SDR family oxidoreductase [Sphingobium phenoxybenzoativorans]|uniref:SDR family oxidoreductase n=1 Tax=Sphingobium phenoxybenzoativorans TaxID=1592790 RepID=UPI00209AD98A|nr:SDR family oxidoreductase [Sphingobium phenoxybenzoativorans]
MILTGASGGIGSATARRFARDGARLILSDFDEPKGSALADELGARFIAADVTRECEVEALVQAALNEHGRLDVMINNAGQVGAVGSIAELDAGDWSRTFAILLDSVFFGMKHAARAMIATGHGGTILSTTSVAGLAPLGPHAYTTAKHAVVALTQSVAAELAAHQIRVNAVAPGRVLTGMTVAVYGSDENVRAAAEAQHPLGTTIDADEIAGAFAFLAGDDARNITGQILAVDSGVAALRLPPPYYTGTSGYIGGA